MQNGAILLFGTPYFCTVRWPSYKGLLKTLERVGENNNDYKMKKIVKLLFTSISIIGIFLLMPPQADADIGDGCWPLPAEVTTFVQCPDGFSWVIRCDCGPGYCTPGSQTFCD